MIRARPQAERRTVSGDQRERNRQVAREETTTCDTAATQKPPTATRIDEYCIGGLTGGSVIHAPVVSILIRTMRTVKESEKS